MVEKGSIKEYFRGKNLFLTGGSGFIGKALIEKLLRSCPDVGKIYILLRPKKGKSLYDRVEQILSSPLFDQLKENKPSSIKKIIPINGDAAKPELGLSQEDKILLTEEVHIFCHAAASVRFDDFLTHAIFTNVRSAREAALLALEMKKIEVFMHLSTTYCNIHNKEVIEEVLYPSQGNWKDAIQVAESCNAQTLNILSQKFTEGFPNTYTYTKLLAEHCINDMLVGKIPTVICRPSVVVSSLVEPFQGWVDNVNGPVGLLLAGGSGLLRSFYADPSVDTDYMAVDNVVKIMIVAVWHKAAFGDKSLSVYHASKHDVVFFNQKVFVELGKRLYWDVPFEKKIWFPGNTITKCWYNYFFNVILFQMVPAFFLDIILRIAGYPTILVKIQRKIYIGNMAVSHFTLNQWSFVNTKTLGLLDYIPKKEFLDFNFKIVPLNAQSIYEYYLMSCNHSRIYLLKEEKTIKEETRVRTRWMYYLDRAVKLLFFGIAVWLIFFKLSILHVFAKVLCNYWSSL